MTNTQWGTAPQYPKYGPGSPSMPQPGKDPFRVADITGSLIAALGVIGILIGILVSIDEAGAGPVAIVGSICFAALGLLLSAVARIGSGLWKAGHIK